MLYDCARQVIRRMQLFAPLLLRPQAPEKLACTSGPQGQLPHTRNLAQTHRQIQQLIGFIYCFQASIVGAAAAVTTHQEGQQCIGVCKGPALLLQELRGHCPRLLPRCCTQPSKTLATLAACWLSSIKHMGCSGWNTGTTSDPWDLNALTGCRRSARKPGRSMLERTAEKGEGGHHTGIHHEMRGNHVCHACPDPGF